MTFVRIWRFRAVAETVSEFREAYAPAGPWARLFAGAPGYLGTELLESATDATTFVTIDRWESEEAWTAFLTRQSKEYAALDARCAGLTVEETEIGAFRMATAGSEPERR